MKFVLELVLATIIIFFVWNILKRLFFSKFYNLTKQFNQQQQRPSEPQHKKVEKNVKWDAETVEFEEIKEDEKQRK